jgi:hypothetical protein
MAFVVDRYTGSGFVLHEIRLFEGKGCGTVTRSRLNDRSSAEALIRHHCLEQRIISELLSSAKHSPFKYRLSAIVENCIAFCALAGSIS